MRRRFAAVHGGLSWLTLFMVFLQFFLAGVGAFGAASYAAHRMNGMLIGLAALLLLLTALAGGVGRARVGMSAALFVLMVVQTALVELDQPWLAALHPVVGLAILGATFQLAVGSRVRGRRGALNSHAGTSRAQTTQSAEIRDTFA